MRTYMAFCNLMHIAPAPISQAKLARYIAYLASRLSYNSIKQYINIVRLIHIESGLANPLDVSWYIKSLMMGCKRVLGSTSKPKLAMTVDLLQQIFQVLDLTQPFQVVFWAACLIAFFSFLRKSNLFVGNDKGPQAFLRRRDITFLAEGATLTIHHSKTIQHGERQLVIPVPHIAGSHLCPATAMLLVYKLVPGPPHAPLLCYPTLRGPIALSYRGFLSHLKSTLKRLGIDSSKYAGHSFRRGGVSYGLAQHLPVDLLKLQGDWRSDCYQRYLEPDLETKFMVARAMGQGVQARNQQQ